MAMLLATVQPSEYTPEDHPCWDQMTVPKLPLDSGLYWSLLMTLSYAAVVQLVRAALEQLVLHFDSDLDLPLRNGSSATSVIDN